MQRISGFGFFIWFLLFLPLAAAAKDLVVHDGAELQAALRDSRGGTIQLAPGRYGPLEIDRRFPAPVILQSQTRHGAAFGVIRLTGAANLHLDGLAMNEGLSIKGGAADVTVTGALINGVLYCRDVDRLTIRDSDISGGQFGLVLNSVRQFVVAQNRISRASEDLMRITGRSWNGLVEYNIITDAVAKRPKHPDLLQFFGTKDATPHDIVIRRNLMTDPEVKGDVIAQGIFVSDPRSATGFRNLLIEENLISTRSANSIYINGGQEKVIVRKNSLIPGNGDGGAILRLARKSGLDNSGTFVEGNVAKLMLNETGAAQIGQNLLYGRKAPLVRFFSGPGRRWQDFQPVLNSPLDRSLMGPVEFLAELRAGKVWLGPDWQR